MNFFVPFLLYGRVEFSRPTMNEPVIQIHIQSLKNKWRLTPFILIPIDMDFNSWFSHTRPLKFHPNVTKGNGTKNFFSNMLNGVMIESMFTNGNF